MGIVGTGQTAVGTRRVGTGQTHSENGNSRERDYDTLQRGGTRKGREQTLRTVRVGKSQSETKYHTVSRSRPVPRPGVYPARTLAFFSLSRITPGGQNARNHF